MIIKYNVEAVEPQGDEFHVIGADENGRRLSVTLPFKVEIGREVLLNAEEGSGGGEIPA